MVRPIVAAFVAILLHKASAQDAAAAAAAAMGGAAAAGGAGDAAAAAAAGGAAAGGAAAGGGTVGDPAKDCETPNGFKYEVCGADDASTGKQCCSTEQVCVGAVKVKVGTEEKDAFECSASRALTGSKAVKVIIVPLTLLVFIIFVAVYMVIRMNFRRNHITKLCLALIVFTWPLLFSQLWAQGVWTAFLALWIAYASNCNGLPWWVYRLTWSLQVFQLVLLFGPTEAFHVPLFNQSLAGEKTQLIERFLAVSETKCDEYYEGFFTRLAIEKAEVEANPDNPTYGLCTKGWLGFINIVLVYHGIILIIMVLTSADYFLEGVLNADSGLLSKIPKAGQAAGATKLAPEAPAGSPQPPVTDLVPPGPPVTDQPTVIDVEKDVKDPAPPAGAETKSESLPSAEALPAEQAINDKGEPIDDMPGKVEAIP